MTRAKRATKPVKPVTEWQAHSGACDRTSFSTGFDWVRCPRCSMDAALELVQLRAFKLRHEAIR